MIRVNSMGEEPVMQCVLIPDPLYFLLLFRVLPMRRLTWLLFRLLQLLNLCKVNHSRCTTSCSEVLRLSWPSVTIVILTGKYCTAKKFRQRKISSKVGTSGRHGAASKIVDKMHT